MAKRGRKPQKDAKRATLVIRFQDSELNAIKHQAKSEGIPVSTYIRNVLLNHFESEGIPTELPIEDLQSLDIDNKTNRHEG